MACTGIEFCKLAIVETKATAARVIDHLERTVGRFDGSISINVNGCPNACARTQIGDIGLKGQLVPDANGELVKDTLKQFLTTYITAFAGWVSQFKK